MDKKAIIISCILTLTLCVTVGNASDEGPIEGRYVFGSKHPVDPPSDEKIDRVGIEIWGDAAKAIYDAIPAKEEKAACSDGVVKRVGKFECAKIPPNTFSRSKTTVYACNMGFILATGEAANVFAC